MRFCSSCGHELGVGRFCTNCGQPIDRTTPAPTAPDDAGSATAERRAARRDAALTPGPPRTPPSADDTPSPPRFPLYADEVEQPTWAATATDLPPVSGELAGTPAYALSHGDGPSPSGLDETGGFLDLFTSASTPAARTPEEALAALDAAAGTDRDDPDDPDDPDAPRRRAWPWVVAILVGIVVGVAVVLAWVATRDPSTGGNATAVDRVATVAPASLTSQVEVSTPGQAPPSVEPDGDRATFVGANLLDERPQTAWRVAGDARGKEIVFTFADPVTISEVGLVNGYAKVAQGRDGRLDWYHGNRTVKKVAWAFDDGTVLEQALDRDRRMQTLAVDDLTTRTLTLRLLDVSAPGTGRARRDFTAISDVTFVGVPAT